MRFFLLFCVLFFSFTSTTIAAPVKPQITSSLRPSTIFVGDSAYFQGNIKASKRAYLRRVEIRWGVNGKKSVWTDDNNVASMPTGDAVEKDFFYDAAGTYTITITATDSKKRKATKKLTITVVPYDPELEPTLFPESEWPVDPDPQWN